MTDRQTVSMTNLITTLTERVSMRSGLLERAAGRKSDVLDATQALREEEATLSTYAEQLLEAQASLAVAETEKTRSCRHSLPIISRKRAISPGRWTKRNRNW